MKRKFREEKKPFFTKQKLLTILIGLFLAGIMITSVLNMGGSSSEEEKYKYKGKTFIKTDRGWITYIDNVAVLLPYGPKELENISMQNMDLSSLNNVFKLYLSIDPSKDQRMAITNFKTYVSLKPVMVTSCHVDIPECADVPLKTCEDASDEVGVIVFKESENATVTFENNCLTFSGKTEDIIKVTNKFIWAVYGVA